MNLFRCLCCFSVYFSFVVLGQCGTRINAFPIIDNFSDATSNLLEILLKNSTFPLVELPEYDGKLKILRDQPKSQISKRSKKISKRQVEWQMNSDELMKDSSAVSDQFFLNLNWNDSEEAILEVQVLIWDQPEEVHQIVFENEFESRHVQNGFRRPAPFVYHHPRYFAFRPPTIKVLRVPVHHFPITSLQKVLDMFFKLLSSPPHPIAHTRFESIHHNIPAVSEIIYNDLFKYSQSKKPSLLHNSFHEGNDEKEPTDEDFRPSNAEPIETNPIVNVFTTIFKDFTLTR